MDPCQEGEQQWFCWAGGLTGAIQAPRVHGTGAETGLEAVPSISSHSGASQMQADQGRLAWKCEGRASTPRRAVPRLARDSETPLYPIRAFPTIKSSSVCSLCFFDVSPAESSVVSDTREVLTADEFKNYACIDAGRPSDRFSTV